MKLEKSSNRQVPSPGVVFQMNSRIDSPNSANHQNQNLQRPFQIKHRQVIPIEKEANGGKNRSENNRNPTISDL